MGNKNKTLILIVLIVVLFAAFFMWNKFKTGENKVIEATQTEKNEGATDKAKTEKVAVPNLILKDQYGKEHNLEDYKGKVVFINFWATWCGYCVEELPYLEKVAKDFPDDVVVLGVSGPKTKEAPQNPDITKEEIIEFLKKKNITYPVLFDETGKYFREYGIKFFPTSYVIARDGYLDGYIPGGVSEENLRKIIEEAIKK